MLPGRRFGAANVYDEWGVAQSVFRTPAELAPERGQALADLEGR